MFPSKSDMGNSTRQRARVWSSDPNTTSTMQLKSTVRLTFFIFCVACLSVESDLSDGRWMHSIEGNQKTLRDSVRKPWLVTSSRDLL